MRCPPLTPKTHHLSSKGWGSGSERFYTEYHMDAKRFWTSFLNSDAAVWRMSVTSCQWWQQWCQPCKAQKGPGANRKSQSAKSAPKLTQAVLAINLSKCAYLDFYQLPPLFFMHSYFPLSNTKDVNPEGTVAGYGLKRLKQTQSSSFRWWDMTSCFFSTIFSYFLSHWLSPLVPALSEMTSFLLKMRDIFRQDGSLMSEVCLQSPCVHSVELVAGRSHAKTSHKEGCERF